MPHSVQKTKQVYFYIVLITFVSEKNENKNGESVVGVIAF